MYGALVTVASAKAAFPLVQGKGNWGDLRNNRGAAAYRYTECMIHANLENVLDQEAMRRVGVNIPNFSGDSNEPYFLMTKIPVGALNHNKGTVVGVNVAMPAFNVTEVIDSCITIIKNDYKITTKQLAKILVGPDHRLYDVDYLIDKNEWNTILETGQGVILNRATFKMEDDSMIITAIPYLTDIEGFIENVYKMNDKFIKKYNRRSIIKKVIDISDGNLAIKITFANIGKKENEINEEFIKSLITKTMSKIYFKTRVCEQIDNEAPSMSDGSTYVVRDIGMREVLVHHQVKRKEYKLKALLLKIKELEMDLSCEDLKLMIANDSTKFFKLLAESTTTKEAITNVAKAYKKEEEIARRVIESSFGAFVNKQEKIKASIERIKKDMDETNNKIKNIDEYLISELENLKSKIGRKRTSHIVEYFNVGIENLKDE